MEEEIKEIETTEARTFTEKEVIDIVDRMNKDFAGKAKEYERVIRELNSTFTRLNFLFKVIENSKAFNADFIVKCTDEIEGLITIPEDEENNTKEG